MRDCIKRIVSCTVFLNALVKIRWSESHTRHGERSGIKLHTVIEVASNDSSVVFCEHGFKLIARPKLACTTTCSTLVNLLRNRLPLHWLCYLSYK